MGVHLSKEVIAVGADAVRRAIEILALEGCGVGAKGLVSGAQWGADRMVLSRANGSIRFVAGSTLYRQEEAAFLRAEFPDETPLPQRAPWLATIPQSEMAFCMALAGELLPAWPGVVSVTAYLDRFGHFYAGNRTRIDSAARDLRFVAEGLLALQHWPPLLTAVMDAMGEAARLSVPNGLAAADLGVFTGRLLIGSRSHRVSLAAVPGCVRAMYETPLPEAEQCLRVPHYRRMLLNLERHAEAAAPLIAQIASAL